MALPPVLAGAENVNVAWPLPGVATRFCGAPGVSAGSLKDAVTEVFADMVTGQLPVPVHAPLQPPKVDVPDGVAVSVTEAPELKFATHVPPQLMPDGELVTVPVPGPAFETVSVFALDASHCESDAL